MIIQATKKLRDYLKSAAEPYPDEHDRLAHWHGNIITLRRRKLILLTHDRCRYTLALYPAKRGKGVALTKCFLERLDEQLAYEDFGDVERATMIELQSNELAITITSSRRVLGTMTQMAFEMNVDGVEALSELEISKELNHRLYSMEDDDPYERPERMLRRLLAQR